MLSKSYSIFHAFFARQKEEKKQRTLSRQQWVTIDRIVIALLFLGVIVGAIIFS